MRLIFAQNVTFWSAWESLENMLKIKLLKMGSCALGKVPGPFGSILDIFPAYQML